MSNFEAAAARAKAAAEAASLGAGDEAAKEEAKAAETEHARMNRKSRQASKAKLEAAARAGSPKSHQSPFPPAISDPTEGSTVNPQIPTNLTSHPPPSLLSSLVFDHVGCGFTTRPCPSPPALALLLNHVGTACSARRRRRRRRQGGTRSSLYEPCSSSTNRR